METNAEENIEEYNRDYKRQSFYQSYPPEEPMVVEWANNTVFKDNQLRLSYLEKMY